MAVAVLVAEHFDAAEADWARYYGRPLHLDLYGPEPMSARRVASLVRWLPPDAAVWRSAGTAWDVKTELAATTVELLDALLGVTVQVNSKKPKKVEPTRIPRPWQSERKRDGGTTLGELLSKSGMRVVPVR